jgi:hypothetical protein
MRAGISGWLAACGLTAVWLSAALSSAPFGASVPRYSVEDLVGGSEWIVEGTVGAPQAAWDPAHKFIWTHYQVRVLDSLGVFQPPRCHACCKVSGARAHSDRGVAGRGGGADACIAARN